MATCCISDCDVTYLNNPGKHSFHRKWTLWLSVVLLCTTCMSQAVDIQRPNIVFIMSDDMGWNDVSYHGSDQILTPNIDALAYDGVSLHRYYSQCICTPSRAALLTSKYPHRTGMQGYPITNSEDRGIPLTEKLLPAYLKDVGYKTHLVGKWHLGASRKAYLPTERGFDSHFGYRSGGIDYYEYLAEETWSSGSVSGLDMYRNLTAAWDVEGYITDVFTNEAVRIIKSHDRSAPLYLHLAHLAPHAGSSGAPLQAPPETVRANRHVLLPERRLLAGMMSKLDESVGAVVKTLSDRSMLNNTIIVFVSDNGGVTEGLSQNWASNWPLRGGKWSPFEGGVRVAALIWSPMISTPGVWSRTMHVTDWLPTLLSAIGAEIPDDIDGKDQWQSILNLEDSKRNITVIEMNDYSAPNSEHKFSAMISGDYKIITGSVDEVYTRQSTESLLGMIEPRPSYAGALKSAVTYEVLRKMGRSLDIYKALNLRMGMRINCTLSEEMCVPSKDKTCLFNLKLDPCEQQDLSSSLPDVVLELTRQLQEEWNKRIPRRPLYRDPNSDPRLHNNTWVPWL